MNRSGCALILALLLATGGCTSTGRPNGVPVAAQLVAEAPAQIASFTVPHDGTIWIVGPGHPGETRYIVHSGGVKLNQVVTLDPQARSLIIDGKKLPAAVDGGKAYYQIWFQPAPDSD